MATLYIDSDGTLAGTHVLVIGEDGTCLGELKGVQAVKWDIAAASGHRKGMAGLLVANTPGRFLANEVLINELKPGLSRRRSLWKRLKP